ncbi:maleylacetate reductase [Streptomyces sp. NPDC051016]|uniref:maleylacetate reductase n=1 Tax=Streptomyces sp. NPDC051016 TaxID=3365638 RepID=UPI00379888FD
MTDLPKDGFVHEQRALRVVFREGALADLPAETDRLGLTRVMAIAGPRHAARVTELLGPRQVAVVRDARMHVPLEQAEAARARCAEAGADGLVAVGGGSATGLAKAVALTLRIPVVAVPTTYSGSELTRVWGLTENGVKRTGRDPAVAPSTVLYDPALFASLPAGLAVPSAFNALAHAVEALYAPDRTPMTDVVATEAVGRIVRGLSRPAPDTGARTQLLYGAWLSGTSLDATTMSLHHKLCHVLGGSFGLAHAPTHTVVLPYALAHNEQAAPEAAAVVAGALDDVEVPDGPGTGERLRRFAHSVGAPTNLRELGLAREDVATAARLVLSSPYANPAPLDEDGVRALLDRAWSGAPA